MRKISFKSFINEVYLNRALTHDTSFLGSNALGLSKDKAIKMLGVDSPKVEFEVSGVTVMAFDGSFASTDDVLILTFGKNDILQLIAILSRTGGDVFKIHSVEARQSSIKAAEVFANIIRRLGWTLISNEQSEGGRKIWRDLINLTGVTAFAWDPKSKTQIELKSGINTPGVYSDERGDSVSDVLLIAKPA